MRSAQARIASPSRATLVLARVRSNRPDGPSFKARWLALSSGSPSERRDPGGAVQCGAVAHSRGALSGRGLGGGPGTVARAWAGARDRVRDGARLPVRGARRSGRGRRDAGHPRGADRSTRWLPCSASCSQPCRSSPSRRNWRDLGLLVTGTRGAPEPEQQTSRRDRELAGVGRLSHRLLDADGPTGIARVLLDELTGLFELDVANLALVEDDGRRAQHHLRAGRRPGQRAADRPVGLAERGGVRHQHRRSRGRRLRGVRRRELSDREQAVERHRAGQELRLHSRCGLAAT